MNIVNIHMPFHANINDSFEVKDNDIVTGDYE